METLKKNYEFRRVYGRGRSVADRLLVLYVLKTDSEKNLYGVSVSKKVGKSVVRSRVTRLIKENIRLMEQDIKPGHDIVIIARIGASGADFYDIKRSLGALFKRQKLFI
ncbi:MAG: ribonuclease P protein component [Firmicutes bacterium]|nr:ribonuclease P protein component [Bacillota bacterium]